MNPIKRLKTLWRLSKLDLDDGTSEVSKQLKELEPEGDGSAVFFSDGTDNEYQEYVRDNSSWGKFYKKLKKL